MAGNYRIKSAAGRWAGGWGHEDGRVSCAQWLSQDMMDLWDEAIGADAAGKCKELAAARKLAGELGCHDEACEVVMPMGEDEKRKALEIMARKKGEFIKEQSKRQSSWSREDPEVSWNRNLAYYQRQVDYEASVKRQVKYVKVPSVTWGAVPGSSTLFDGMSAKEAIEMAAKAMELRKLLPKARAQVKKLGFVELASMAPKMENLGVGTIELAGAKALAFNAAEEFDDKPAIALYVDRGADDKGFVDKKGYVKNDLAEACLFPSEKSAMAFARRTVGHCHAVEVKVSAISYKPLMGKPGAAPDLAQVISARERRELEQALSRAKIDELEEELAKRKAMLGESEQAPAPVSKGRGSRL